MTDAIIFSLSRALTILPVHKMPLGLQKSEFLYLFEEKLTSMYIFYLWEYTHWVVSLELSGECVWKGFYLLSYLLSFFLLLLSFLFSSAWRGFMQWVVSLELPGECVWKGFIFPRDISVCTRHTQTIYSFSSSNSFYLISF